MASSLYISIPCTYENKTLTVKSLRLQGKGETPEQALIECIKNTPLYMSLVSAKFKSWIDFRHRSFMHLEIPYDAAIMKKINDLEPTCDEKKNSKVNKVIEPTQEEIFRFGF